jgi:hypothetical protein
VSRLRSSPRDGSEPQFTLRKCGLVRRSSENVRLRVVDGTGYAEGVVHCGSIHGCAVCAAKIRGRRSEIYGASAGRWLDAGNTLIMVTLTFPHDMGMRLDPLWDLVSDGAGRVTSSVRWRKLKLELGGEVWYRRAIEQTYGDNGWHPHCHMLIYIRGDGGDGAVVLQKIEAHFKAEWAKWITGQGYRLPSNEHGVKVEACHSGGEAGEYIVKTQEGRGVGNEIVRADLKTGRKNSRTPFELLRDFSRTGDKSLLVLWWEFEQASKGRRAITQSQGLGAVLGETEVTDQELADEEAGGIDAAELPGETWAQVCARELEAQVFEAAAAGGLAAVNDVLAANGCGLAHAPPLTERGS